MSAPDRKVLGFSSDEARELVRQVIAFGLVGVVNTCVGLGVFYAMLYLAGAAPGVSNVVGHLVGVCVSFLLNSKVTFQKRATIARAARFLVAFGASLAVNLAVLYGGIALGLSPGLAQLPAMVSYTATFFLISRLFVFR